MKNFSIAGMFKGLLAASLLAGVVPSAAWATDHLLSVNGATVTQSAVVNHSGAVTTPLILSNFDSNTTLTLGDGTQTLTVVSAPVKMCKPGTNNQLEWLDQGNTVVGVTGVLTSGTSSTVPINGYRLTLTMTGISDTYGSANGPCTVRGDKTYTYTPSAVIEQRTVDTNNADVYTTKLTSTYNFWNATNGVPEPGTVALMLLGLLGMAWTSMKRIRSVGGVSA